MEEKLGNLKKSVNIHLERMDIKTSITTVTISEIKSHIHKLENTIQENYEQIPEPDAPSWTFPGDIVELHAPEDDVIFLSADDNEATTSEEHHQQEDPTIDTEVQEEHGNTPYGLSPTNPFVPAGAEEVETDSSTSTNQNEETVEEELATFFANPSYRTADPELL